VQGASGYAATIVSGTVTRRDGVDTGARPGRLVRGARWQANAVSPAPNRELGGHSVRALDEISLRLTGGQIW